MFRTEIFNLTGKLSCKKHGEHSFWRIRKSQKCRTDCLLCEKEWKQLNDKGNPKNWYKKILRNAKDRARINNLPVTITSDWIKERVEKNNFKCEYSGIAFDLDLNGEKLGKKRMFFPSLDQRIAGQGYTEENTSIICSVINTMKQEIPTNRFIEFCSKVSKFNSVLY